MKYTKGYKYRLEESEYYTTDITGFTIDIKYISLKPSGRLCVKDGYAWDGPSGPTIDTKTFMRGSLIHDALYELLRKELIPAIYKNNADKILRKICLEDGMCSFRAWYVYKGVQGFGRGATLPENKKEIYNV